MEFINLVLSIFLPKTVLAAPLLACTGAGTCNFCTLAQTLNNIQNWVIIVATLIAVILIAVAGFRLVYSKGDPGAVTAAKELLGNVVIGLFVMLSAWLIVDTLTKALVGGEFGVWNRFDGDCGGMIESTDAAAVALKLETYAADSMEFEQGGIFALEGPESALAPGTGIGTGAQNQLSQPQAAALLNVSSISVSSSGNCSDRSNSSCTSFENMNNATIQRVLQFQGECNCSLVITGGTEVGHANGTYSHYNGFKIDIRPSTQINNYITTNFKRCGSRGGYCDAGGTEFVREFAGRSNDHWDITVK